MTVQGTEGSTHRSLSVRVYLDCGNSYVKASMLHLGMYLFKMVSYIPRYLGIRGAIATLPVAGHLGILYQGEYIDLAGLTMFKIPIWTSME